MLDRRRQLAAAVGLFAVLTSSGCALFGSGSMPNVVGMDLKEARSKADTAGFSNVHVHDASGGGRVPIRERDWIVCFQSPAPGTKGGDNVDLGVVRDNDQCPTKDESGPAPKAASGTMPDLRGTSLAAAKDALPSGTVITPTDLYGHAVMVATHWKICTETPSPGAPLASGQKVSLGVVKLGADCPRG